MQKAKKTMPSRTGIPPDAQAEILQKLSAETKITSCEIAEILKKHDVCGDMDALQDAYRKRLGQRLLSGIRDENGKREILSTSGGEYVIVDCCNDPQKLKAIQRRIQAQINGLERIFQAVLLIYLKTEANARRDEDIALVEHDALIRKLLAP